LIPEKIRYARTVNKEVSVLVYTLLLVQWRCIEGGKMMRSLNFFVDGSRRCNKTNHGVIKPIMERHGVLQFVFRN
jgi:hypothetical protein